MLWTNNTNYTTQDTAVSYQGTITVNGTSYNGLVILPDDCTKNVGSDDWSVLESAGAVFLPAAGIRVEKDVQDVGIAGYYWSCSGSSSNAYRLTFASDGVFASYNHDYTYYGYSVRLVREFK